jgi:hypothetical protein
MLIHFWHVRSFFTIVLRRLKHARGGIYFSSGMLHQTWMPVLVAAALGPSIHAHSNEDEREKLPSTAS